MQALCHSNRASRGRWTQSIHACTAPPRGLARAHDYLLNQRLSFSLEAGARIAKVTSAAKTESSCVAFGLVCYLGLANPQSGRGTLMQAWRTRAGGCSAAPDTCLSEQLVGLGAMGAEPLIEISIGVHPDYRLTLGGLG